LLLDIEKVREVALEAQLELKLDRLARIVREVIILVHPVMDRAIKP
jgi:hypothetical protein